MAIVSAAALGCSSSSGISGTGRGDGGGIDAPGLETGTTDAAASSDAESPPADGGGGLPGDASWEDRCEHRLEANPPPPPRGLGAPVDDSLFSVTHSAFCSGAGTAVPPPPGSGVGPEDEEAVQCTGRIAADRFRFGLCACGDLQTNGDLVTDAFDSLGGAPEDTGSAVGANGNHNANGALDLGGSLLAVGCEGVSTNTRAGNRVRGDIRTHGTIDGIGEYRIDRDLRLGIPRRHTISYHVFVDRDYVVPPGAEVPESVHVGGDVVFREEEVEYPCNCDGRGLPDPADAVARAAARNDNELLGYDPATASEGLIAGARLAFACGRYYFPHLRNEAAIIRVNDTVLETSGRVVLFLDGDLRINGSLRIEVPEGKLELFVAGDINLNGVLEIVPDESSEVDVFVTGDLTANGTGDLGASSRARNVRVYASGSIQFNGDGRLVGNFFSAEGIAFNGDAEIWGSLITPEYSSNGGTTIHYDRAILVAGGVCQPGDDLECSSNDECDEFSACVDGSCGACRTDGDCSAPLICTGGRCEPLLI